MRFMRGSRGGENFQQMWHPRVHSGPGNRGERHLGLTLWTPCPGSQALRAESRLWDLEEQVWRRGGDGGGLSLAGPEAGLGGRTQGQVAQGRWRGSRLLGRGHRRCRRSEEEKQVHSRTASPSSMDVTVRWGSGSNEAGRGHVVA